MYLLVFGYFAVISLAGYVWIRVTDARSRTAQILALQEGRLSPAEADALQRELRDAGHDYPWKSYVRKDV